MHLSNNAAWSTQVIMDGVDVSQNTANRCKNQPIPLVLYPHVQTIMDKDSCIKMFNDAVAAAAEEPIEGRRRLRELQVMFLNGDLCASHTYMCSCQNDHMDACRDALVKLNKAGVFTDNGQERSYESNQRGYVCGHFLTRSTIEHVQEMFDALDCSYGFYDGNRHYIRLRDCDFPQDVFMVTKETKQDLDDTVSPSFGRIYVTESFTHVNVETNDVFGQARGWNRHFVHGMGLHVAGAG
jgi:hypothetical protein